MAFSIPLPKSQTSSLLPPSSSSPSSSHSQFHYLSSSSRLYSTTTPSQSNNNNNNNINNNNKVKDAKQSSSLPLETDVIIIGSGLAGLSCGALLSHNNIRTILCESHDIPGGAAHSWTRRYNNNKNNKNNDDEIELFHFESGPSLYSGFSSTKQSPNPLKNIFQIINEEPIWITYDRWGTVLPNGEKFAAKIGPEEFHDILHKYGGGSNNEALEEFQKLMKRMEPLSTASQSLTSLALREDIGVLLTTAIRYPYALLGTIRVGQELNNPFSMILEEMNITNDFVRNWLDMLCFLLQGLPASGTMNAVIAYMLADWYRPGVTLDYPMGGSGAIVDALVRGIVKYDDCDVYVNCHVRDILVENGRAVGVRLENGQTIRATRAVVSNADPYITKKLLQKAREEGLTGQSLDDYMDQLTADENENEEEEGKGEEGTPKLKSFIHLHAGITSDGLPTEASADFPTQWAVIRDWNMPGGGVEAPRNIVLCSMPSLIDPSMSPKGTHVIHAYVPATEPYDWWKGMDRRSMEYKQKKEEAADFLWSAIEEYIPNARDRAIKGTVQIGTPLTHERFLRRTNGSYGPRAEAGKQTLPGHTTPLPGLLLCGDYTFPGIGVPATAASGAIVANTLMPVWKHWQMLDKIQLPS